MLSYEELCRNWNSLPSDVSRNDYINIKTAVKAFIRRSAGQNGFDQVDEDSVLSRIVNSDGKDPAKGRQIRLLMSEFVGEGP